MMRASDPDVVASPCTSSDEDLTNLTENIEKENEINFDDAFLLSDSDDLESKEITKEENPTTNYSDDDNNRAELEIDEEKRNFMSDGEEEVMERPLTDDEDGSVKLTSEEEDYEEDLDEDDAEAVEDNKTISESGELTSNPDLEDNLSEIVEEIEEEENTFCISVDENGDLCGDFFVTTDDEDIEDRKPSRAEISNVFQGDNLAEVLENLQITTQEPWPKDVKLYQPYEVEQILLPDNANCLAVQAFLKMCELDFQVEPRANAEAMSPSGKVPFIKAGAFVVSELEGIVQFVNSKGITLTDKLDADQKADMRAYMSLVHNVMEVAELYICWCDNDTYNQVTSVRHGHIYPWPLNHIQNRAKRNAVIKKLKVLGWYQKSISEVFQEVENCCQALTDRLEGKDYFFGDKPTELDALVFGHIFSILTTPLPNSHIANTVRSYSVLIHLAERIEREYFKRETKH